MSRTWAVETDAISKCESLGCSDARMHPVDRAECATLAFGIGLTAAVQQCARAILVLHEHQCQSCGNISADVAAAEAFTGRHACSSACHCSSCSTPCTIMQSRPGCLRLGSPWHYAASCLRQCKPLAGGSRCCSTVVKQRLQHACRCHRRPRQPQQHPSGA